MVCASDQCAWQSSCSRSGLQEVMFHRQCTCHAGMVDGATRWPGSRDDRTLHVYSMSNMFVWLKCQRAHWSREACRLLVQSLGGSSKQFKERTLETEVEKQKCRHTVGE